ncbi:DDE-type integrase/transposase/recombinase [Escherichia coli]|uniref:DDE-type integrase/transposase/recombinase n=1 Tax=Escherichia coli TaxID=562 RepID=UPI000F544D7E|nr:DDE-type integrase/transposase/recombinase [Escherichia coli]
MDETYVKVNGRWAFVSGRRQPGPHCRFFISCRNSKAAYRFRKILNNVKKGRSRDSSTRIKRLWSRVVAQREGRCPSDVEHRQIGTGTTIECDHGKLKRIIGATLGFKSMKTAYATIKGIEVMRALRKGQASAFYYGDPLGEMRLVSRVFEM